MKENDFLFFIFLFLLFVCLFVFFFLFFEAGFIYETVLAVLEFTLDQVGLKLIEIHLPLSLEY